MTDAVIQVTDLQKSFTGKKGARTAVLKGVYFEVRRGEIFALLGSNGAGKTTTVRILSTVLKADGGSAQVCGYDVARQADKVRERISLTGQFAAVDGMLTGRENLLLIARLRGVADPANLADGLLERFGLAGAAHRRADTYSGGMTRRLDIAMSLVGSPTVLFLDEPTTGLDPEARLAVWQTARELADGGTTILLTTQYLEEAEQLAQRIAILHDGRIIANGTLGELEELLPPAKEEYVIRRPTLEEVFLAIINAQQGGVAGQGGTVWQGGAAEQGGTTRQSDAIRQDATARQDGATMQSSATRQNSAYPDRRAVL
jgi:ABC-2 type transport system ATP-binding protein